MARNKLQVAHLTKRVASLEQGLYTADSNTDGYGSLMAAVAMGAAKFLGEDYPEVGIKSIAVEVGGRVSKNPEGAPKTAVLGFGEEFYSKALEDYAPWQQMWWREGLQNAVDAGVTKFGAAGERGSLIVKLDTKTEADGTVLASVEDNGGGMPDDVLFGKFLTLGPSGKAGVEGMAGGFGEAKRLLLLPWVSYEIHTRSSIVRGKFGTRDLEHWDNAPHLDGTKLTVRMPSDNHTTIEDSLVIVNRSYLPQARIYANGKLVHADLEGGDEIDEFDAKARTYATLYYKPRARKEKGFFVRKNGIYMFEYTEGVGSEVPGYFVLELLAKSTVLLYANRMGFKDDYDRKTFAPLPGKVAKQAIGGYIQLLARDTMKATKKKKNILKKKWRGKGKFKAKAEGDLKAMILQKIGAVDRITDRENVDKIKEMLGGVSKERENEEEKHSEEGTQPAPETTIETRPLGSGETTVPTTPIVPKTPDVPIPEEDILDEVPEGWEPLKPGEEGQPGKTKWVRLPPGSVPGDTPVVMKPVPIEEAEGEGVPILMVEGEGEFDDEGTPRGRPTFAVSPDVVDIIMAALAEKGVKGADQVEAIVQQLAWEPDFYIEASIESFHVPLKFTPEKMTSTLRKLAKFWGELCRVLLAALGKPATYGIGWIFKEDWDYENQTWGATQGEYIRDDEGEEWLMLNPFRGGSIKVGELYSLRNDDDLKLIHATALHEVTHLLGFHGHNDRFAGSLTSNIAKVAMTLSELKKIRDIVVKRPPGWKPAPKAKKIKFTERTEEIIKKAEKEFKASGYKSFYLPSTGGERDVYWRLDRDYKSGGRQESVLYRDNKVVAKTEPLENDQDVDVMLGRFRSIIAKHRPDLVAKDVEVSDDLKATLEKIEARLIETGRSSGRPFFNGMTGFGSDLDIDVRGGWEGKAKPWTVVLSIGGRDVFDEDIKAAKKDTEGWEEKVAKAVVKAITPTLAAHWRE